MRAVILIALSCLSTTAFARTPDREPAPDEWGYRPCNGCVVSINPPSITWVSHPEAESYELEWAKNREFARAVTTSQIPWTAYTHHRPLKPGTYYWRYRVVKRGGRSDWSQLRRFTVPASAVLFPLPTAEELRSRVPRGHPRLFLRAADLPKLRQRAAGERRDAYLNLVERADELAARQPTQEPDVRASEDDPATNRYWWSNRLQALRASQEAEILAFAYLLTGNEKYAEPARRYVLQLASWDPDGPTNFSLNCEAAKPLLYRLARAYDWAYAALTEEDRRLVRSVLLRRALDAWNSDEVMRGGRLNRPYSSHAGRTWHKLAENAIATLGETPESEKFLLCALSYLFAVYPVWSDEEGGWHEGLAYYAAYLSKAAAWMKVAQVALGIDSFKKPFFRHFGEYPLYTAPPGSPDAGFGDLSYRPPSPNWWFMYYFTRPIQNPYWAWWSQQWKIRPEPDEPVLSFLIGDLAPPEPRPPVALPASKVFRGIGVAVLNSNLLDSAENVQVRFKSSPLGRRSHGHDPQNSFTLNAYGAALLVNNVYRDLYGSPFHGGWCWSTRSQNAVLVNGEGQKPHSADLGGRILHSQLEDGVDYVVGDAAASYEGKLTRFLRHMVFVKPNVIVIADDLEATRPVVFQWMLHALDPLTLDEERRRLKLEREKAGLIVDYVSSQPLHFRQWTGYEPPPDDDYLKAGHMPPIPAQWHVEAATSIPIQSAFTLTVLRPYRRHQGPGTSIQIEEDRSSLLLRVTAAGGEEVAFILSKPEAAEPHRDFVVIRKGEREWRVGHLAKGDGG